MKRVLICCVFAMLFVGSVSGQAQKTEVKGKSATSFTEKVLKYLGISDSPGTLKGPGDEVRSGELWIADLQSHTTRSIASLGGYCSPILLAGDKGLLVLRGTDIVQLPIGGGQGRKLYSVDGILKLVGASSEDASTVLILLRGEASTHPRVGLLMVRTGAVTPVPYSASSSQDLQLVEDLEGWSRTYGDRHVYVKRQSEQSLSGMVEWSDIFLQTDGQAPIDVSHCDGVNCGQPSLSADGRWLVFVKGKAE